jgi:ADP-heptose:LPS heptosyltransferase
VCAAALSGSAMRGDCDGTMTAADPINYACRHFLGSRPCVFNKTEGAECPTCRHAAPVGDRVLFIKLDAIGDVLRSASMVPILRARHPGCRITWLTLPSAADLVRMVEGVDEVVAVSEIGMARIATGGWDHVYSLSNDVASASLASMAATKRPPVGFAMRDGVLRPGNAAAARWLAMAVFDRLKRANTLSYQRLMAEILEAEGPVAPPALVVPAALRAAAAARVEALFGPRGARPRVAINLGSGARWPKKMIDAAQTARCCALLRERLDAEVMLLGGAAEGRRAEEVMALVGADPRIRPVLTAVSIPDFVATMAQADALLCGDTLALHVATAVGVPTVAVFGPTSQAEIDNFGGLVAKAWTDALDCLCCYGDCDKTRNCMTLLEPARLVDLVAAQLRRASQARARAAD